MSDVEDEPMTRRLIEYDRLYIHRRPMLLDYGRGTTTVEQRSNARMATYEQPDVNHNGKWYNIHYSRKPRKCSR